MIRRLEIDMDKDFFYDRAPRVSEPNHGFLVS